MLSCRSAGKGRWKAYSESLSGLNSSLKVPELVKICKELVCVLTEVPRDEHVALTTYMSGLALKMLSRAQLGSYFEDDDKVTQFYRQYESMNNTMGEILNGNAVEDERWKGDIKDLQDTLKDALNIYKKAR